MFESFIVTDHIMERYLQRVSKTKKDVMRRIKKDLHFSKVRQIINNGNVRHVFTFHSKEFIFVKDGSVWVLKTIIKRNRVSNQEAIEKRKQLVNA
ncbi:hypothetical protein NST55_28850 [Bacillus sp. FSL R10-2789]|uniref:hypothetical protein n=1 Tax=Bacillus sp. FSL R10-2789 TaxID=2954662 RepID=UPI0030F73D5C